MEIGFIYSQNDPRQIEARKKVARYCEERGILARIIDQIKPVKSPTVIINGHALTDRRQKPRSKHARMFPSVDDILGAIERHAWSL
jgi:hypothetical protein